MTKSVVHPLFSLLLISSILLLISNALSSPRSYYFLIALVVVEGVGTVGLSSARFGPSSNLIFNLLILS